jgi:hypothetical protein
MAYWGRWQYVSPLGILLIGCGVAQALIGNSGWSSRSSTGPQLYHVGTVPNAKGNIHGMCLFPLALRDVKQVVALGKDSMCLVLCKAFNQNTHHIYVSGS